MTDTDYATTRKDGLMWAECWCQATTVLVTPATTRNGLTGSCDGGEWCRQRPNSPQRNPIRRGASEFGHAVVSGERESPRDWRGPGAAASTCARGTDVENDSGNDPPLPTMRKAR